MIKLERLVNKAGVFLHLKRNGIDVAVIPGTILKDSKNYGIYEDKTNVSTKYCFSLKKVKLRLRLSRNGNFDSVYGMHDDKKKDIGTNLEMDIETCTIKKADLEYLLKFYRPKE